MRNTSRGQAISALIFAALLWSSGGVLIKGVAWHPLALCGARSAIAAATMWALLRRPRFTWSWPQIGGAVAYAASVLLYVSAVKLTTVANAVLLQYSAPVWIALFGASFLGERGTPLDWAAIMLSLVGMSLFFRQGLRSTSLWGDVLGVLCGITTAWMALFLRRQKQGSPTESVLLGNLLAAAVGLPFALGHPLPSASAWPAILMLGVFQLGLSYYCWSRAIRQVTALEAMVFSMIEPVMGPVWALWLVHERPDAWVLAGGLLVLVAVAWRGLAPALRRARQAPRALPQA